MLSDSEDEGCLQRARQGSREAFSGLVERYYDMVYSVVFGVLNHREQALDVTQDVFLKIFQDLGKFHGKSKFRTWLYRVAVNAAIDFRRKRRPMETVSGTEPSDQEELFSSRVLIDISPGPLENATQSEMREKIEKALEKLTPEQRAILVLREWQELSYEEIAGLLSIEIGTVMSRLFYARKKLAEILGIEMKEAML